MFGFYPRLVWERFCKRLKKAPAKNEKRTALDGQSFLFNLSGEYRARTDDLLHAMQAL